MTLINIRQLQEQAREILRQVCEEGIDFEIMDHGRITTRLTPANESEETAVIWKDLDQLAAEIGQLWPENVGAVEAVNEGRRLL